MEAVIKDIERISSIFGNPSASNDERAYANRTDKNNSKFPLPILVNCLKSLISKKPKLLNFFEEKVTGSYPSFFHEVYFCELDSLLKSLPEVAPREYVQKYVNENIHDIFKIGITALETIASQKDLKIEKYFQNIYFSLNSIMFSEIKGIEKIFKNIEIMARWIDLSYYLLIMSYHIPRRQLLESIRKLISYYDGHIIDQFYSMKNLKLLKAFVTLTGQ
ncbi:hypothetical protein RF11_10087 [Thelohanellus kitauei]|uniref:Uncharacterized protein n=1 Tax=Thelohanellus kitauei TaxID=669202 RepID=A0A0C2MBU8_THEKT|nr:hypothetical protein RF11_10087 [Thelohanellus kitauei]